MKRTLITIALLALLVLQAIRLVCPKCTKAR